MPSGLLTSLTVVEYGQYISGPYCAKLLGDLGARVIKLENPDGDFARKVGPFPSDVPHPEKSGLFLALNTSKKGVVLDLKTPLGQRQVTKLLNRADIFVENQAPDGLKSLGLDYDTLHQINPQLIVTSISPFGQSGPYRNYKATDLVSFHMSGYAYQIQAGVEDPETEPPLRAGGHQAEFIAGVSAATATMMAILLRQKTGKGTHVDLSTQEAMAMMPQGAIAQVNFGATNISRRREDRGTNSVVTLLPTSDGYIAISPREDHQWQSWIALMGNPAWSTEERFATREARQKNWDDLEGLLSAWTSQCKKETLYRQAQNAHIPAFPVNTASDLFDSIQLQTRGFFTDVDHPIAGKLPYTNFPYTLSQTELQIQGPAPTLGQHNDEILSDV